MPKTIQIQDVTEEKLRSGKLRRLLPEIYDLKRVVENNVWHKNQTVFDHTVGVFQGMREVLDFRLNETLKARLASTQVGTLSRSEALLAAALLHDIAKPVTWKRDVTGITSCPWHEEIGSTMVPAFADRLCLDLMDVQHIQSLIKGHGFAYGTFTLISDLLDLLKDF